jgi:hypothetical protein
LVHWSFTQIQRAIDNSISLTIKYSNEI